MKKDKHKAILNIALKTVPILLVLTAVIIFCVSGKEITVESVLNIAPQEPIFAAAFMVVLYAVKCILIFIPIDVLRIAAGMLFPPTMAVAVNLLGALTSFSLSYWIGRSSGTEYAQKLLDKHPKLTAVLSPEPDTHFRFSLLLRGICFLPIDVVSLYLGAIKVPFPKYIAGSMLGVLPSLISVTLLGANVKDAGSPMFWVSLALTVLFSAISIAVYLALRKKNTHSEKQEHRMHKTWYRALLRRRFLIIFLIILQVAFFALTVIGSSEIFMPIRVVLMVLSLIAVLHIVSKKDKGAYKLIWVFLILVLPLFGGLLYILVHIQMLANRYDKRFTRGEEKARKYLSLMDDGYAVAAEHLPDAMPQVRYLQHYAGFPIYTESNAKYLSSGEMKLEYLLRELEKAEKYIFMEYFIIEEGVMWGQILDILKRKAASGVRVRIIYDDLGCFFLLPKDYPRQLERYGIECAVFNPFKPFLTVIQNNRDHRKIVSIDGKVSFTGGINLADEYINAIEKHGHWKDAAVMVSGKAAWSFTTMFLQMWHTCTGIEENYDEFFPWKEEKCTVRSDGFIQPYTDTPLDTENVGEHVYLQIINNANRYVYINTPYLIVDDSMLSALTLAAKSGVDVRIVTPHQGDKWFVHMTTRSYYRELISAGVKIYEYSKGFIHAKTFVSDDNTATVGTTNLDFRSLYLHFECGAVLYNSSEIIAIKDDYLETLKSCEPITAESCRYNAFVRLVQDVLRLFAPLM